MRGLLFELREQRSPEPEVVRIASAGFREALASSPSARSQLRSRERTELWTHCDGLRLARRELRRALGNQVRRQRGAKGAFCDFLIFPGAQQHTNGRISTYGSAEICETTFCWD
jgi:hypothetical protein